MTPWSATCQASLSFSMSWNLRKLVSIESVMPSNHLILCRPLLLRLQSFPASGSFPNESALHIRRPKYWSFSISPSSEYSGLISFRIDWFDLLAVQILKSFESLDVPRSSPCFYTWLFNFELKLSVYSTTNFCAPRTSIIFSLSLK